MLLAAERVLFCPGARCYYRSALPGSLSGRKSAAAWASQFRVIELCECQVRAREDSERVRRGFALSWQHLAHACYPYEPALADRALKRGRIACRKDPPRRRICVQGVVPDYWLASCAPTASCLGATVMIVLSSDA